MEELMARKEEEAEAVRATLAAREEELRRLEEESVAMKAQLSGEAAELMVCVCVCVCGGHSRHCVSSLPPSVPPSLPQSDARRCNCFWSDGELVFALASAHRKHRCCWGRLRRTVF